MKSLSAICLFAFATTAAAATLPGFRVEKLGAAAGFASSVVLDSHGAIYYTSTAGTIYRFAEGISAPVATVTTEGVSNSGLLGMALIDDNTAAVHYTTVNQTYDVISRINLQTGEETVVYKFVGDIDVPERGTSPEHHGGNPTVGPDGSIYVGIGDYGGGIVASMSQWNGGKIWRIAPNGEVTQMALGVRNPFDLIWDDANKRLIVPDNGPAKGDDINIITTIGSNFGWPFSFAGVPPIAGDLPPVYTFINTIAPTGILQLNHANPQLRSGILLTAYVTKAIYFFPDIDAKPLPDPIPLILGETGPVIDVAQSPQGDIVFVTGNAVYRLIVPRRGDCNGDGRLDTADLVALERELADAPESTYDAQNGSFPGSWGCDANGDGIIDANDLTELIRLTGARRRAVRPGR
ncbi:MAG TPA: PQQ-dependent sugar dehydrogenase [Thermoanaerobaculia bacterium]